MMKMDYKSAPFWCAGRLELEAVPKSSKWLAEVVNIFFFFDHKFGNIFFWNPKKTKWTGQTGLRQRCRCRQWPLGDAYRTTSIFTLDLRRCSPVLSAFRFLFIFECYLLEIFSLNISCLKGENLFDLIWPLVISLNEPLKVECLPQFIDCVHFVCFHWENVDFCAALWFFECGWIKILVNGRGKCCSGQSADVSRLFHLPFKCGWTKRRKLNGGN